MRSISKRKTLNEAIKEFENTLEKGNIKKLFELKHALNRKLFEYLLCGECFEEEETQSKYEFLTQLSNKLKRKKESIRTLIAKKTLEKYVCPADFQDLYQEYIQRPDIKKSIEKIFEENSTVISIDIDAVSNTKFIEYLWTQTPDGIRPPYDDFFQDILVNVEVKEETEQPNTGEKWNIEPDTPLIHAEVKLPKLIELYQSFREQAAEPPLILNTKELFTNRIDLFDILIDELIECLISLNKTIEMRSGYVPVAFGKQLTKILELEKADQVRGYSFIPIAYLLKFWECEIATLMDHRLSYIGFQLEKDKIRHNIQYLSTKEFNPKVKDFKNTLLSLFCFLYEKYSDKFEQVYDYCNEIKKLDEYKRLYDAYVVPFRIVSNIRSWAEDNARNNDKFLKKINEEEHDNKVRDKLGEIEVRIQHNTIKETEFTDLFIITHLFRYIFPLNKNNRQRYSELIDKIKVRGGNNDEYFDNNKLSYDVEYYGSSEISDEERIKIDKAISESETSFQKHYFAMYKKAFFYYLKVKHLFQLNAVVSEIQSNLKQSIKYQQEAEKCFDQEGQFFSPLVPFFELSTKTGLFTFSTFIGYQRKKDGERIKKLLLDIQSLYMDVALFKEEEIAVNIKKEMGEKIKLESDKIKMIIDQSEKMFNKIISETTTQILAILAIFATIVVFSISEIQLFKNFKETKPAIIFTFGFAASLGLFSLAIYDILTNRTRRDNNEKVGGLSLVKVVYGILALIVVFYLFFYEDYSHKHTIILR